MKCSVCGQDGEKYRGWRIQLVEIVHLDVLCITCREWSARAFYNIRRMLGYRDELAALAESGRHPLDSSSISAPAGAE